MFRFSVLKVLVAVMVAAAVSAGTLLEPVHIFVLQDPSSELQQEIIRMVHDATKSASFATDVKIVTLRDRTEVPFSTRTELDRTGQFVECYKWATGIRDLARRNDRLFRRPVVKHIIVVDGGRNCTLVDLVRFAGRDSRLIGVLVDGVHTGGYGSGGHNVSSLAADFAIRPFYAIDVLLGPVMAVNESTDEQVKAESVRRYVQGLYDASVAFDVLYRTLSANSSVEKLTPKALRLHAAEETRRPLTGERFLFGFLSLCLLFLTVVLTLLCTLACVASISLVVRKDHMQRTERLPLEDAHA